MDEYYGPCDVRSEQGVMRLQCELNRDGLTGYVTDLYRAELHDLARQRVTLCLPGRPDLLVRMGEIRLLVDEPIGWRFEREEWRPTRG